MTRALLASLAIHLVLLLAWRPPQILSPSPSGGGVGNQTIAAVFVAGTRLPASEAKGPSVDTPLLSAPAPGPGLPVARREAERPQVPPTRLDHKEVLAPLKIERDAPSGAPTPAEVASASPDQDAMTRYRLDLAREARRFKRYPPLARERGWEGVVIIWIVAVPGGFLPSVTVDRSSGFDLLDEEALAMVTRAVKTSPPPDGLAGRGFTIVLPIHYRLED